MYFINIGGCGTFISASNGRSIIETSTEHTPNNQEEVKRVLDQGGSFYKKIKMEEFGHWRFYKASTINEFSKIERLSNKQIDKDDTSSWRIFPGDLQVSYRSYLGHTSPRSS